jgi:hypothetical protein
MRPLSGSPGLSRPLIIDDLCAPPPGRFSWIVRSYSAISRSQQAPQSAFCAFELAGTGQNRSISLAIFPSMTR